MRERLRIYLQKRSLQSFCLARRCRARLDNDDGRVGVGMLLYVRRVLMYYKQLGGNAHSTDTRGYIGRKYFPRCILIFGISSTLGLRLRQRKIQNIVRSHEIDHLNWSKQRTHTFAIISLHTINLHFGRRICELRCECDDREPSNKRAKSGKFHLLKSYFHWRFGKWK